MYLQPAAGGWRPHAVYDVYVQEPAEGRDIQYAQGEALRRQEVRQVLRQTVLRQGL